MKTFIFIPLKVFLVMTVLTGIIYPIFITLIGQTVFANKANGSLLTLNGKLIGSELIGQKFKSDIYFQARPSAVDYNPLPSGGSNLSVTSKALIDGVKRQQFVFDSINQLPQSTKVPAEMLYASGSGLDPHITAEAANLQTDRIIKARHLAATDKPKLLTLIESFNENRQLGFLGEKRVNVLKLNMQLDNIFPMK